MPVKTRTSAPIFEVLQILKQLQADIKDIKQELEDIKDTQPHHIFIPTDEPKEGKSWFWN
jgi:hypothetical protein